jgi:predicted permease
MMSLWQDVHYALRILRKRPLFTTVVILTLGIGIGSATAVFSVVDGVLLKPLPYEDPSRLVNVWEVDHAMREVDGGGEYWDRGRLTYPQYRAWREAFTVFQDAGVFRSWEVTMTGQGRPRRLTIGIVSASLLPTLGVQPALGRWFLPEEEGTTPGDGAAVAILSDDLWRSSFSTDPEIVGRTIVMDDMPYVIVGVLPPDFRLRRLGPRAGGTVDDDLAQLWVPIGVPGVDLGAGAGHWEALARLPSGASLDAAEAEARNLLLADSDDTQRDVRIVPRIEAQTRGVGSALLLLLGTTGLLMLIACANIATLLLGEMHGRRFELATRNALGAGSRRVLSQLLTESLVLGFLGSALGLLIAWAGTQCLVFLAPPLPRLDEVAIDLRVLSLAIGLGMLSGLIFGTVPALVAARDSAYIGTRGNSRSIGEGGPARLERCLVSLEIALTTVLLVGCGLFTQSLYHLLSVDPGFDTAGLVTVHVTLSQGTYPTDASRALFSGEALGKIKATPGVLSASATDNSLFPAQRMNMDMVRIPGGTPETDRRDFIARFSVAADYFDLMAIPVLAGRTFSAADEMPGAMPVMVICETMANRYWPGESPIGTMVRHWIGEATIIGVVGDVKFQRLDAEISPTFFVPLAATGSRNVDFIVKTELDPSSMLPFVREAIWSVDGSVPIGRINTMAALVSGSSVHERFRTRILLVFGVVAMLLAATGVFGVTARNVARHIRELGIRAALGATTHRLLGMVLRANLTAALAGAALGLVGAFWASRMLTRFLFGVEPTDPLTYGTAGLLLVAVCVAASYVPARRITNVDPVEVLRAE